MNNKFLYTENIGYNRVEFLGETQNLRSHRYTCIYMKETEYIYTKKCQTKHSLNFCGKRTDKRNEQK